MRPLIAEIRLAHAEHNYRLARARHGGRALATIKANGYGHGALQLARHLSACADGFAVSCLEEAVSLRDAGIDLPILLLEGVFEAAELREVEQRGLWLVVQNPEQLAGVLASRPAHPYRVWLKMDSGMHRAGFAPDDYRQAWDRLLSSTKVDAIVKMTHFANADAVDPADTARQIEVFDRAVDGLPGAESLANSAGILLHPSARRDWARPGIMLYGASPCAGERVLADALKPVMRLKSRVFGVRELPAGQALGYGSTFVTSRPTRVGLVACGYADGYPRMAASGCPVAVDGGASCLIGRVSMDMLMVDLTDLPASGIGSEVELWGDLVPVNQVAESAGTVGYEVLCNVKRAHFEYC
jgi:alanine racemase